MAKHVTCYQSEPVSWKVLALSSWFTTTDWESLLKTWPSDLVLNTESGDLIEGDDCALWSLHWRQHYWQGWLRCLYCSVVHCTVYRQGGACRVTSPSVRQAPGRTRTHWHYLTLTYWPEPRTTMDIMIMTLYCTLMWSTGLVSNTLGIQWYSL